jgi:hypothetical protein
MKEILPLLSPARTPDNNVKFKCRQNVAIVFAALLCAPNRPAAVLTACEPAREGVRFTSIVQLKPHGWMLVDGPCQPQLDLRGSFSSHPSTSSPSGISDGWCEEEKKQNPRIRVCGPTHLVTKVPVLRAPYQLAASLAGGEACRPVSEIWARASGRGVSDGVSGVRRRSEVCTTPSSNDRVCTPYAVSVPACTRRSEYSRPTPKPKTWNVCPRFVVSK